MNYDSSVMRQKVTDILQYQGLRGQIDTEQLSRESKRDIHAVAKRERLCKHREFLLSNAPLVRQYMVDGRDIDAAKIKPTLRIVQKNSIEETLFKWWNLAWWSLPYERAYGRQMRFIVWDEYHNAPMGLIGLQSPILRWKPRDEYLGLQYDDRDYWVNQSMSAQRLGALPPYNSLLGGKLVGMMLTTDTVRQAFYDKYSGKKTEMMQRVLPANLLFITTTGAFGKSSVYDRLKFEQAPVAEYIGLTKGNGSFHIPDKLYSELVGYLDSIGYDTKRGYGSGPSTKMKLINTALKQLGIKHGSLHGIRRALYIFPLVSNLQAVIAGNESPKWYQRSEQAVADFWRDRWAIPRSLRDNRYRDFVAESVIEDIKKELEQSL